MYLGQRGSVPVESWVRAYFCTNMVARISRDRMKGGAGRWDSPRAVKILKRLRITIEVNQKKSELWRKLLPRRVPTWTPAACRHASHRSSPSALPKVNSSKHSHNEPATAMYGLAVGMGTRILEPFWGSSSHEATAKKIRAKQKIWIPEWTTIIRDRLYRIMIAREV